MLMYEKNVYRSFLEIKKAQNGPVCTARGKEIAALQPARARRMCQGTFFFGSQI